MIDPYNNCLWNNQNHRVYTYVFLILMVWESSRISREVISMYDNRWLLSFLFRNNIRYHSLYYNQ